MNHLTVPEENILKATKKPWKQWVKILTTYGAKKHGHLETARWLKAKHKVPGWWAQFVTIRYEKEKGYWKRSSKK